MNKYKKNILSFLVVFMLYLNGIYIEYVFAIKPFQIFLPLLGMIYFAKNSLATKRESIPFQFQDIFFTLFLLLAIISLMYLSNISVSSGLRLIANLSILFVYYLFAKALLLRKSPEHFVAIILIASLVYVCLSLLVYFEARFNIIGISDYLKSQSLGFVMSGAKRIRMSGLEIDPNFFVLYLTPGLILSIWIILNKKAVLNKKLCYAVFLLSFICVNLSLSRAGILINSTFIVLILLVVFKRITFRHLFISSIIIIVILGVFYQEIMSRFNLLETEFETVGMGRYSLLLFGLDLFKQNPFWGLGFNQFAEYFAISYGEIRYSHNTYLSILVELGLVGLTLYLAFIFIIIKDLYKISSKVPENYRWIYYAFIIVLLSQCAQISSLYAISSSAIWMSFILSSVLIKYQQKNDYQLNK